MNKLVEYFRDEGWSRYGFRGDEDGLSPEDTAIRAMREFDEFLRSRPGDSAYIAFLHAKLVAQGLVPA